MAIKKKLTGKKQAKAPLGINIHSGSTTTTTTSGTNVAMSGGQWSSGTYLIDPYEKSEKYPSEYETLEMNWVKLKETIGETEYNKLLRDAVKQWLRHDGSYRVESLLKHEGVLDTKRENSLNNLLLDDEDDED